MKCLLVIFVLLANVALPQSAMFNSRPRYQPKISIPHVEAREIIGWTNLVFAGTNSTTFEAEIPIKNPQRNLKFSDFILVCAAQDSSVWTTIEQRTYDGTGWIHSDFLDSSILWIYSSSENLGASWTNEYVAPYWGTADVYYSDVKADYPESLIRNLKPEWEPLVSSSTNHAAYIEVFPHLTDDQKWKMQQTERVKWMCLLSNGVDVYRDRQNNPVWFECRVDMVRTRPAKPVEAPPNEETIGSYPYLFWKYLLEGSRYVIE